MGLVTRKTLEQDAAMAALKVRLDRVVAKLSKLQRQVDKLMPLQHVPTNVERINKFLDSFKSRATANTLEQTR